MRVALIGLGFFAEYHADAWRRLAPHMLVAGVDPDPQARARFCLRWPDLPLFGQLPEALVSTRPDIVDIVTRPEHHTDLTRIALAAGSHVICQKPLALSRDDCRSLVDDARDRGKRLLVHDNWRFQPWYGVIKRCIDRGEIGRPFMAHFRVRAGDGRGGEPFPRQPYFRAMQRFFFLETGIHFLDVTRYLFGEVSSLRAMRGQVRTDIAGEDLGVAIMTAGLGTLVILDGNRWTESPPESENRAFCTLTIEGTAGQLSLAESGAVAIKLIGAPQQTTYVPSGQALVGYRGDSVFLTCAHLVQAIESDAPSPLDADSYIETMELAFMTYDQL